MVVEEVSEGFEESLLKLLELSCKKIFSISLLTLFSTIKVKPSNVSLNC